MVDATEIIGSVAISGYSEDEKLERLMRKFELDRKIFENYDDELKNPISSCEISSNKYQQLAICFCLQAIKQEDIRFYNTALKIGDLIDLSLPELKAYGS